MVFLLEREVVMAFGFGEPSDDEIWEKISSDNVNSRVEGLLDAARKVGFRESNPSQAFNYLEPAVALADEVNDFVGMAHCYMLMGNMHSRLKAWEACAAAHEAGADAAKRSFRADLQIDHLAGAARAFWRLGNDALVRQYFELAIALAAENKSWHESMLQGEYGRYLRKSGDLVSARQMLEAASVDDDVPSVNMIALELVTVLLDSGDNEAALKTAREVYSAAFYNDITPLMHKAQFGMVRALVACELFDEALVEVEKLIAESEPRVKHRMRMDLLKASALIGLEREDEALTILNLAIPLLGRYKLWNELGDAYTQKSSCALEHLDTEAAGLAAIEAYEKGGDASKVSDAKVRLAISSLAYNKLGQAEYWADMVLDDVLQVFSEGHKWSLALGGLAKAKLGKTELASPLIEQLFTHQDLTPLLRGHGYYAKALIVGGAKGRNLAVKAMKAYLEADVPSLATEVSALV